MSKLAAGLLTASSILVIAVIVSWLRYVYLRRDVYERGETTYYNAEGVRTRGPHIPLPYSRRWDPSFVHSQAVEDMSEPERRKKMAEEAQRKRDQVYDTNAK